MINSEVRTVGGDGVVVSEASAGALGFSSGGEFNFPTDPYPGPGFSGPNIIHHNTGVGVTVDRLAEGRIVGNYIHNNGGDGIRVRRNSQADVASNLINSNKANALRIDDNSNVSLGTTFATFCSATSFGSICGPPFVSLASLANTISVANTSFGIKCTVGGSISGKATTDRGGGPLSLRANAGGSTVSFGSFGNLTNDNCIDKTN
jgi:Right handed beta helix region